MTTCFHLQYRFTSPLILLTMVSIGACQPIYTVGSDVGINVSTIDGERIANYRDTKFTTGFCYGAAVELRQSGTWRHRLEVSVIQRGASIDYSSSPYNLSAVYTLTYLDIAVMEKRIIGDGPIRPFVALGPSLSILLSGDIRSGIGEPRGESNNGAGEFLKSPSLTLIGTGGMEVAVSDHLAISIGFSCDVGMLGIWNSREPHGTALTRDYVVKSGVMVGL